MAIEDSEGETVTEITDLIEVRKHYCRSIFCDGNSRFDNTYPITTPEERGPIIFRDEELTAINYLNKNRVLANPEYFIYIVMTAIKCITAKTEELLKHAKVNTWPNYLQHELKSNLAQHVLNSGYSVDKIR